MRNRIALFCLLLLAIVSILLFVYFQYEKPNQVGDIKYANVSISAFIENSRINTGFEITRDGYFYKEGETLEEGAILVKVPINSSYIVSSKNIENQSYYPFLKTFIATLQTNYRVDLNIIPPGNISISHFVEKTNNKIVLILKSDGPYNDFSYCIDWSINFLWVKSVNDSLAKKRYYSDYVNCFDTNKSLSREEYKIELFYKEWDTLGEKDYVKILIFDKGYENGEIIFDKFGGQDLEYTISGI